MTTDPGRALPEDDEVVLRAVDIVKAYGGTTALKGVGFEARRGQVTALFGENGAGKSTLMKILAGIEQPTSGHLELDGEVVDFATTNDARARGIAIIHQELNLCGNLSVRDNVFLGRELRGAHGGVDFAGETRATRALMERLEEPIDPSTPVSALRLGQQQVVEIARALAADARILIMDEPTSALSAAEVKVLFKVIDGLTAEGVAVIYVSHHLEEAMALADHCVVFRDGELVASASASDVDLPWIVHAMVGRAADYDFSEAPRDFGPVRLSVEHLSVVDRTAGGRLTVDDVSFQVRSGEVVCLYGLMGAGRTELMEALAGRETIAAGRITVDGHDLTRAPIDERIAAGMGLVPEDRQRDGIVQMLSVGENLSLASMRAFVRGLLVSRSAERGKVDAQIANVHVKTDGRDAAITSLSGGNQQKVAIGRMLMTRPTVLLLDEPTRGIDVGAKGEIFRLLFREAGRGLAVLFVTSEVSEALAASHRVIVMRRGRIAAEFDPASASREDVMVVSDEEAPTIASGDGAR